MERPEHPEEGRQGMSGQNQECPVRSCGRDRAAGLSFMRRGSSKGEMT